MSENSVPLNQWLMIIIPIKWLFHWEYTLSSDKPESHWAFRQDSMVPTSKSRIETTHPVKLAALSIQTVDFFAYDMSQWYTQQWNIANYSNSPTWNLQPSYLGMIPHIINHDSRWFQASGEQNGDLALVCWWSCYREHRLNHNNPTYQKKTTQKRNHGWFCDVLWM